MYTTKHIISEKRNGVGWIKLNRPKALNALTLGMIQEIHNQLTAWQNQDDVAMVCIHGEGEKAYCAGGDVRRLYDLRDSDVESYANDFFTTEYKMNMLMHNYSKPILAYMNGIVMGGGVGISVGAKYRIVTEKTKWAMPEMNIGLYPDVGGSYFLNKMPGHIGRYLALTSSVISAADTLYIGAADFFMVSSIWEDLKSLIEYKHWQKDTAEEDLKKALNRFVSFVPRESELEKQQCMINRHFKHDSIEDIFLSLKNASYNGDVWATNTLKLLQTKSPTSLKVTLEQLIRGKEKTILECFKMELKMSMNFMKSHDFFEGVRAVLVDKDRSPKWNPSTCGEVSEKKVKSFFEYCWESGLNPLENGA